MRLFSEEVKNFDELEEVLSNRNDVPKPYSVAVEALVFDSSDNWILMERGPGCRDEIGKLEGIGGRVENDSDFRSALKREIVEEVGNNARIDILRFFEARKDTVEVPNSLINEKKHWVIISYICFLRSGELVISEPEKNHGFIRVSIEEIDPFKLSSSAASALISLKRSKSEIKKLLKSAQSRM